MVITENVMNGKWFPGKDKEFRFGHISFKLKVIKLTERQPSGTTGERCRTIRRRERRQTENRKIGLRTTAGSVVRETKQFNRREVTEETDRDTAAKDTQKRHTEKTQSEAKMEEVKQQ